ncbi:MAG: cyclic beta 1-2 glucan synthetase [Gemmatimonadaceae bacterium]|nr:cyclic beta 1-2 glucan synthetase [Gemmatimonadaceae bacterium]
MATRPPPNPRRRNGARQRERTGLLARLLAFRRRESVDDLLSGPIRGTLLGADQLAERARQLARSQRSVVRRVHRRARLLARLQGTERVLTAAHARLLAVFAEQGNVGPAGEWLLDNFHVVREHILEVNESLPSGYYRELPELTRGTLTGFPRVYEIAIALISHTEGRIDLDNVDLFVSAFQQVTPLSIGELWAIPAMLRLGLLESIRRMSLRSVQRLDEVERADEWAHRIQSANESGIDELGEMLRTFVSARHALTPTFVSRFLTRLRLASGAFPPLVWLESWIDDEGLSAEEASARSTQRSAMTQIVMANSITSLRAIARRDWQSFVERQSVLERVLQEDPAGHYARQTFATRDRYRHVVETIAKRRRLSEIDVARVAVDLAIDGEAKYGGSARQAHVGYFLVDHGLAELEEATDYRPPIGERLLRLVYRHPNVAYFGGILVGTLTALAALLWLAGPAAQLALPLVLLVALLPANALAIHALNDAITSLLPPTILPKLDLAKHGIPTESRTVVVVPTLFGSVEAVHSAIEHLEVQFLANRMDHLHFALLSDYTDAAEETRPDDAAINAAAVEGVRALNARYRGDAEDTFFLFHRSRKWNPSQGVWMGWERKRGKLSEFNHFLRTRESDAFSTVVGDTRLLRDARYVITLDSDTVLPPNTAATLIGTISHPLNQASYDEERRIAQGYGIVQPRVGVLLPSAHRSQFAAIHSGHPGVDPYTTAVSDVYQDLYGEGSFTGKGIYDVDVFERATHGRFPENTLLSHDLIEGNYARVGLATDITVFDEYPSRYLTYTRRKHRWIRGDWQLLQWLTSRVPGPDGMERNRLSKLSRWKLFDNMRRSTVEIAQFLFLAAGWTILPGSPLRWTLLGLGGIAAPWIGSLLLALVRPPRDKSWRAYYAAVGHDAITSAQQLAQAVAFLPHQAYVSADAIVRTLYRLFVSRRHLLEWQTASQTERLVSSARGDLWRPMWPAVALPVLVLAATALTAAWRAGLWPVGTSSFGALAPDAVAHLWLLAVAVGPLVLLWVCSPEIALRLSALTDRDERRLSPGDRAAAMRYALLHWRFFERFVSSDTNWLAPDNVQDRPTLEVAMRTSPTNVGLQLLSIVSAHDLGLLTVDGMVERLEQVMRGMDRMARFRGHFFNWYDLHDLRVLEPAYISTVDSGNLAGHLIALRQACLAVIDEQLFDARLWRTLAASIALATERLASSTTTLPAGTRAGVVAALRGAQEAAAHLGGLATRVRHGSERERVDDIVTLAGTVQRTLREASALLGEGGAPVEDDDSARGWIAWSLSRLEAQIATVTRLAGIDDGDRARLATGQASLRQLATDLPAATDLVARLTALAERAYDFVSEMDFRFLYDDTRKLFSIGYQTTTHACDGSYYDLLASEARLASFVAIAKGDVPVDHWFRLGRTLTRASGATSLVSWSGSMFEYLMPALVMESLPLTLLGQTYRTSVRRQEAFAVERDVPWGVSESAYNMRDRHLTYQYRAFGIPDLALKRGLGRDLVIAPYATMLAAMIDLQAALPNLARLERIGALGPYGFRDAVDFTRPEPGRRFAVVHNYMAHHIGMSFVSLTNVLHARSWQRRFHADPLVQSAELLLHERVPRRLVLQDTQVVDPEEALPALEAERAAVRVIDTPDTPQPQVALLGATPYTVMVSQGGAGYSQYEDLAVTRWRADGTRDDMGQFCFVRDVTGEKSWSTSYQPSCATPDWYHVQMATDCVTFHRADGPIETRTEITVVSADAAEVRRVTVTNNSSVTREVELTSYAEIVLGPADADRSHPAFANLFVETEWHAWCTALSATRRPRAATETPLHCMHLVDAVKEMIGSVSCETDRARFIGRGRTVRNAAAMSVDGPMAGTTGAVLDPILSLRLRLTIDPGASVPVTFTTLVAATRERAFELAGRYHDLHAGQRALDLTGTSTQIELRELDITPSDAAMILELAGHLLFVDPLMRGSTEALEANTGSQPRLWANGISGDVPILLAHIESAEGLPTLRQLLVAHHFLRRRGLKIDLVIVNAYPHTYQQELNERITEVMFTVCDAAVIDHPGGVFLRRRDLMAADDLQMLEATARVVVRCDGRALSAILDAARDREHVDYDEEELDTPPLRPSGRSTPPSLSVIQRVRGLAGTPVMSNQFDVPRPSALSRAARRTGNGRRQAALRDAGVGRLFENGIGGLDAEGDYEMTIASDRLPPAPWVNVIANPHGGCIVSESGAGATWAENSYFYRLTPWHNDPVSDPASDVLYLRDESTGDVWSATPAPVHGRDTFTVRHGAGTSSFATEHAGIATTLTVGLAPDAAVKLSLLTVTNVGAEPRRLSVTAFVEWVLGVTREQGQHVVRTAFDREMSAILARNHFDPQFTDWVAFLSISEPVTGYTGDRRAFIGRNGSLRAPAALGRQVLGDATGVGLDPCGALQCEITLAPGETRHLVVQLGAASSEEAARALARQHRTVATATAAVTATTAAWHDRLSVITVETPEPSFDAMLNRWTLYQALGCRMWARSALYQSSGAYGFRDQLQDVMAFVYAEPAIARAHILVAAARQFVEGDVQHWWHPQSGRGVRTRFSDDLVWLPFVVDHYVSVTGDRSVLDAYVPFLSMRPLGADEHEVYELPTVTDEHGSVYEHCLRALRRACTVGAHGLPLIGTGDWNDGMSRVGVEGRGESVWLAWFLVTTLRAFARRAVDHGDLAVATDFTTRADAYAAAVEAHGWDGEWYRRAYFDDGTPLGSAASDECRIDSIAQSWSVISGAGAPDRQAQAMASFEARLVREDARILMLLTPPFDKTPNDPGYIKGYLPGVRENGAQYTHAALWAVLATAMRGDGARAFALYQMLNPLTHADTPEAVATYKVEPYVVAADVYTAEGQLGRGGWTWYTGSASWMYRVALEGLLGFTKRGDQLTIAPCIPPSWDEFTIDYRHGTTAYAIRVSNPNGVERGVVSVEVDGTPAPDQVIVLADDGALHEVVVRMGQIVPAAT